MSQDRPATGAITWTDLTVPNAEGVRDFYAAVVGWKPEEVPMAGYNDFAMKTPAGTMVAGICHARGQNEALPPAWLVYIAVDDMIESLKAVVRGDGEILDGPREMGGGVFACIKDPAGAVCALWQAYG
jgi:predicted enzyme related to lactoylglutathione lyase